MSLNSLAITRFSHKLLNLTDHPIELVDEIGMIAMLAKRSDKRAVIPKGPVLLAAESLEHFQAISSKVSKDRARVMQFIGSGHQACRRIGIVEMLEVSSFPFQPRRLWRLIGIGATINDPGDIITKFFPDIAQSFRATAIFHRIMKKRADRFGLIRAVLKRESSDTEDMRDVRNPGFFARLITMRPGRISQCFLKFPRQLPSLWFYFQICRCADRR